METTTKTSTTAPNGAATNPSSASNDRELTRKQRDQFFDEAAQGMVPEHQQKKPEDPLKKWWPQIKRKLKEGYSVRQIHAMTLSPKVGLNVSRRALQRLITEHKTTHASSANGDN